MAVYTDLSEADLTEFLQKYDIGELLSYQGIAEGVENTNFLLNTQTGFYILTLYEKRVKEGDLPFFLHLMQYLSQEKISCPIPIQDRNGEILQKLAGRPAALISFLKGIAVTNPAIFHCREVGRELAKLHLVGQNFALHRKNSLSVKGWSVLWEKVRIYADQFAENLVQEIDQEIDYFAKNWPENLPMGIIHADLFPDNVFFLEESCSGVIDFYFACNDSFIYDLAICLNAWCFEKDLSFNLTKAKTMVDSYCSIRQLNEVEYQYLPFMARAASLRFFLTRIYDWFFTPEGSLVKKKDPEEYLRKLHFFQGIKTVGDLGV